MMNMMMQVSENGSYGNAEARWKTAKSKVAVVDSSTDFERFVGALKELFPWRFTNLPAEKLERDYLRIVNHHLDNLIPLVQPYINPKIRRVLDFGCGSGGSAIALALAYPELHCYGTDIDEAEIDVANKRAALYGVADRCQFYHVEPCRRLPFADGFFDFSQCSSVLEYATEEGVRKFCVQEMARLVSAGGLLFFSVPNRLYPFEIHTGKWGWNYFPKLLSAQTVDSTYWEVRSLARPTELELYQTPIARLLRPWTNFCLRKG